MLVLVAGVTGNMGQNLVTSLKTRGHQVRGLGRSSSKLQPEILSSLEKFVEFSSFDDIPALNTACSGVDAVICAYGMDPRIQLEGQLLLLRAAERAGINIFVAQSWNHDWSELELGQHEAYDSYVSFQHHVKMTSDIKPIYVFTGIFAETLWSTAGHGHVGPDMPLCWNPVDKTMNLWGTGQAIWPWTTEHDAAEFTAAIVQHKDAALGGYWNVCSGANTLIDIAKVYEQERGVTVPLKWCGTVKELRAKALKSRAEGSVREFWRYTGWFYQLHVVAATMVFDKLDNDKLDVKPTSLSEFLAQNSQI